ncbi:HAD-IB family hydrolase [Silanimonas sp.]|jgi:HAD superfamily hydrolase (TIGR01490 family)|uniref:HAD-IB family hydrolase n=1 Tax=Silanimonas sp. TaxID=1929290 RepID=UPI0037C8D3EA
MSEGDTGSLPRLALFDFDGTLTTVETFPLFVRSAAPQWRVRLGGLVLAPMVLAYRAGWVSGVVMRAAIVRLAFSGMARDHFDALALTFATERFPALIRPEVLARLRARRAAGDRVVVVSGNFEALLREWCEAEGVELLASALECRDGRLTGRYDGPQCAGEAKVERIRALVGDWPRERIEAHGDTVEDLPMLALAATATYRGAPWSNGDAVR